MKNTIRAWAIFRKDGTLVWWQLYPYASTAKTQLAYLKRSWPEESYSVRRITITVED